MIKLTNCCPPGIGKNYRQKFFLIKPFVRKLKQLETGSQNWLNQKRKQAKNLIKKIPLNYRNIPAKAIKKIVPMAFLIVFVINLALPVNQALRVKQAFLSRPEEFNNQVKMIDALIASGYLKTAKKELNKTGNPNFLSKEEKAIWQEKYLLWAQNSPEGQKELINSWQNFLKEHPDYKIGWLYLGCCQLLTKNEAAAKESFQKAKNIDPGLEKEIKNFQFSNSN